MLDPQIIASFGVFILLFAFALNLLNILPSLSAPYLVLNFVGAAIAAFASWIVAFYPFVVLEGVWALVSLITLVGQTVKK